MARVAYALLHSGSPSFKQTLFLCALIVFCLTFTLIFFTLVYTSLCYHQVFTGYVVYCSFDKLYLLRVKPPEAVENNSNEVLDSVEQYDWRQSAKWRNVARYEDVCEMVKTKANSQSGDTIIGQDDPTDFYDVVRHETATARLDKLTTPSDAIDLATVLLPKFSKNLPLNNISHSLYLYNAFHHQVAGQWQLSIVGIALSELYCPNETVFGSASAQLPVLLCAYETHHGGEQRVNATIDCLPEGHNYRFTSVLIQCQVPVRVARHHLHQVKLIQRNSTTHLSKVSAPIPVIFASHGEQAHRTNHSNYDITVCVRPLFDTINVLNLLEFIAYYRANGASNVALYYYDFANLTASSNSTSETATRATRFLQFLAAVPGVRLHSFVLPHDVKQSIHSGAQIATVHDCLLRYPHSVQIHVDIDEFISVQRPGTTLRQWIDGRLSDSPAHVSLYIASVLHCHEFNLADSQYYEFHLAKCNSAADQQQCVHRANEQKNQFYRTLNGSTVKRALIVPNNANCQQTVWTHEIRSKVILLQPKLVKHMGIHNVWQYTDDRIIGEGFLFEVGRKLVRWISPEGSSANRSTEQQPYYFGHRKVDPSEAILRHYRWCCQIRQAYFFELLHFYSVDDTVVRVNSQTQGDASETLKRPEPVKLLLPATIEDAQIEQFVLEHFRTFLANLAVEV